MAWLAEAVVSFSQCTTATARHAAPGVLGAIAFVLHMPIRSLKQQRGNGGVDVFVYWAWFWSASCRV